MLKHIKDLVQGKTVSGTQRSDKWPAVEKAWLKEHGSCAVCNRRDKLQVHHKQPFHTHPQLELDTTNLITLCESGTACHLDFGHLGSFKSINKDVVADTTIWKQKFASRPASAET
jgi:5-methylcytosine-specific restriction enzyme A